MATRERDASTTPVEGPTPKRRKNGFSASCEPCRRSKLSCNHEEPCARCIRGNKQCFYHPCPMTKPSANPDGHVAPAKVHQPLPPTPDSTNDSVTRPKFPTPQQQVQQAQHSNTLGADKVTLSNPLVLDTGGQLSYKKSTRYVSGYLGSTAHSAVLLNNQCILGEGIADEAPAHAEWCDEAYDNANMIRLGIKVLAWLPRQSTCWECVARYFRVTLAVTSCRPMYDTYLKRFFESYGQYLNEPRTQQNLAIVSRQLCKNTVQNAANGLVVPKSTDIFMDSFTGDNSRWDMLGIIFIVFGFVAMSLPSSDPFIEELVPKGISARKYSVHMLELADACLLLCDELDMQSNLLSMLLLYKCCCFQAVVGGDTSFCLWKRIGSLTAAATAFGLHRRAQALEKPYSLLYVELQKRIFSSVFGMSISLATFHGRPPGLSRHYLSMELPLDASEEDLMKDDEDLIRPHLCSGGWNREEKIFPSTMGRAFLVGHLIREEVLEICLGQKLSPEQLSIRVHDVRERIDRGFAEFPVQLKEPLTRESMAKKDAWEIACVTQIQLQTMHHRFLLEQHNHAGRDEFRHLQIARDILRLVNLIWTERDRFLEHTDDVIWFISSFGIPSASTLAVDLYHKVNSAPGPSDPHRPQTIQDLSVFVASLEWVGENDGNFALCQRVSRVFRHILDRVLSPSMPPMYSPQEFAGFDLSDISVANVPAFGAELEDWFSVDWTRYGGAASHCV